MFRRRFTGLVIITSGCLISTLLANAVFTASWGDVVNIRYSLYLDAAHEQGYPNNVNENLFNVYLSKGGSPPSKVTDAYPGVENQYLDQFTAAIIGMEVNGKKEFVVNSTDHNYGADLAGQDLYYMVILLEIVYDASEDTTTLTNGNPSPPIDLGFLLAAGVGVSLLAGGFVLRGYRASQRMESALSDKTLGTRRQDQVLKKEQSQLQELRELTESFSDPHDELQKKEPAKIRRRR